MTSIRAALLATTALAGAAALNPTAVGAQTLDLAGVNVTLPKTPSFPNAFLSGSNNVTNSVATPPAGPPILSEGGGTAASAIYSGNIADGVGQVALTHTSGVTILSGNNTYSGSTNINAGTLQAGSTTGFSANSVFYVNSGGTLDTHGFNVSVGTLESYGTILNNGTTASTLTVGGFYAGTYSGSILDGTSPLALKLTQGSLALAGQDPYSTSAVSTIYSYSGGTNIAAPTTLQLGDGFRNGALGSGNVVNNGALVLNEGGYYNISTPIVIANNISGAGSVTQNGQGTVVLSGNNTYTGGTTVDGSNGTGALLFASAGALSGPLTLINGGVTGTYGTYALDQSFLNLLDPASKGAVAIIQDSSAALNFNTLPSVSLGASDSTCDTNPFCVIKNYSGALTPNAAGNAYNFGGGNAILNVTTSLSDAFVGSMQVIQGANNSGGYTILSGENTNSGDTLVSSGILQFASLASIPNSEFGSPTISIGSFATAATGYAIDQTFLNLINPGSEGTAALAVDSSNNLDFNTPGLASVSLGAVGGRVTYSGTISPYVTPSTNAGTFYLGGGESNPQAFLDVTAPLTDINASGTGGVNSLVVNSNPASGPGPFANGINVVLLNDETYHGQTLIEGGNLYLGTQTQNGNLLNTSGVVVSQFANFIFAEATPITFDRAISGAGNLSQTGPGAVTLTGALSYTGDTTINGGTLALGPASSIASSARLILTNNTTTPAVFDISGAGNQTVQNLFGDVNTTVNLGANTLTIGSTSAPYSTNNPFGGSPTPFFNGLIAGTTGGVTYLSGAPTTGTNIYLLGGSGTYSGDTTIGNGVTLRATAANVFSPNSNFNPMAGGTLDLNGFNQTIGGLDPTAGPKTNGLITNSATTGAILTFGGNNQSTSFFGTLSDGANGGTLGLTKTGTGAFTFAGSSTYSGPTDIQAGTIVTGALVALSRNSAFTVESGATLDLKGFSQVIGSLAGAGTVENSATTAPVGLTVGGVNNNITNTASTTFSGLIKDGGSPLSLYKNGSGTFTLTGHNTYTGNTFVYNGVLSITNANAVGTGIVELNVGTTLQFQGSYTFNNLIQFILGTGDPTIDSGPGTITQAGAISGAGALTKIGTGTLILNATNTYTGNTFVNFGTLQVDGSIATSPATIVASGATLSGVGTVGAIAAQSGSTISPGNPTTPYGSLAATGAVTFAPGSRLAVNVSLPTTSLLTTVSTANITPGSAVVINLAAGNYNPLTKYPILVTYGGLTGTFSSATISTPSPYVGVLTYDANDAFLQIEPASDPLPSLQTLAGARAGLIVTNRVLGSILGGFNEQINCSNCISAFGAVGSFSAGFHGRKALTDDLSLLGGFAYTNFSSGGARVTSSPMFAAALRYDWTEMGALRPFAEFGGVAAPWQATSFSRPYVSGNIGATGTGSASAGNYSIFGKLGVVYRITPKDEASASFELSRAWQSVAGYSEAATPMNPFPAVMRPGVDTMNIAKIGGQWTHLFGTNVETQINLGIARSFGSTSGIVADFTAAGGNVLSPVAAEYTWAEYGLRVGYRLSKENVIDVFADGTLAAKPIGDTLHVGVALRHLF